MKSAEHHILCTINQTLSVAKGYRTALTTPFVADACLATPRWCTTVSVIGDTSVTQHRRSLYRGQDLGWRPLLQTTEEGLMDMCLVKTDVMAGRPKACTTCGRKIQGHSPSHEERGRHADQLYEQKDHSRRIETL